MRTDIVSSVDEIDAEEWNALADGSFYSGDAWMRYQEAAIGVTTQYVLIRDDQGRLAAGVPVYVVTSEGSSLYAPGRLFPELAGHIGRSGRTVLVGNRRGYANRLLVGGPPERHGEYVKQLVDTVNLIAADEADGEAWWLYMGDRDTRTLLAHAHLPVPRLLAADCAIRLPGVSFEDYLRSGSGNMRRQIRKDREAFAAAGYTVTETPFSENWSAISPLIASHQAHHGEPAATELISRLMREQAETAGDAGTVHACHREGRMVGCTLTYETSYEVSSRAYGFDHRVPATAAEYFELLYYRPMEAAYRTGARRLHLGIGTLLPKIRRGAEVSLLWAVRTGNALTDDTVRQAAAHNAARWNSMAEEMGAAAERVSSPVLERSM